MIFLQSFWRRRRVPPVIYALVLARPLVQEVVEAMSAEQVEVCMRAGQVAAGCSLVRGIDLLDAPQGGACGWAVGLGGGGDVGLVRDAVGTVRVGGWIPRGGSGEVCQVWQRA
ncbi:hypothetical protein GCM10017784_39050 [Deinococcus indicus]|nr:hypothetical protein GCM10017784_39050 [Deinococcus indicus]